MRAAPHVATADSACLGSPRLQVGPAAWDVSNPGRYLVLGYVPTSRYPGQEDIEVLSAGRTFLLLPRL